jgi:hypothetical protein
MVCCRNEVDACGRPGQVSSLLASAAKQKLRKYYRLGERPNGRRWVVISGFGAARKSFAGFKPRMSSP